MYFPYLRCKQFELLALRELAPKLGQSQKISPVLEPINQSTTALAKALEILMKENVNFTLILNPIYGDFVADPSALINMVNSSLSQYLNCQLGIIINQFTNLSEIDSLLAKIDFKRPLSLIHDSRPNDLDKLTKWAMLQTIKYNLYSEGIPARRYRGIITSGSKILLEDKFISQTKNANYSEREELFSDDHLYFKDDGYAGFGDYLTIGKEYSEAGFAPYAVAIHLTYIRTDRNNELWIKHFVSDSNETRDDVAGKFGEALEKLMKFIDHKKIITDATNEFREHYRLEHYPGLGSLKKLSIKNHLELLIQLLH